jgi:hypothetical protein
MSGGASARWTGGCSGPAGIFGREARALGVAVEDVVRYARVRQIVLAAGAGGDDRGAAARCWGAR